MNLNDSQMALSKGMTEDVLEIMSAYSDSVTLAQAIGVLEVVKSILLQNHLIEVEEVEDEDEDDEE